MTREDAIGYLKGADVTVGREPKTKTAEALEMAIQALEQKPCEDAISRQAVIDIIDANKNLDGNDAIVWIERELAALPSVSTEKTGRCKDCKYFEYDSFEKINGMQLIVAHEICSKWADGCKTREDGYCFLFEPQTQEVEE